MRFLTAALVLAISLAAPLAHADGSDRAEAEKVIATVSQDKLADASKTEIDAAKAALERARGARDSKDSHHAEMLEGLARTFAETARDLLVAIAAEAKAASTQQQATDTHAQVDREKTLLEEAISRRGRVRLELTRAESEAAANTPQPAPKEKAPPKKAPAKKSKGANK